MLVEEIGMNELQADRIMQLFVDHISVKLSVYRCFISCDCNFRLLSSLNNLALETSFQQE